MTWLMFAGLIVMITIACFAIDAALDRLRNHRKRIDRMQAEIKMYDVRKN